MTNFEFPILMYHALWEGDDSAADPQLRDPGARLYAISPALFASHCRSIANSGSIVPRSWNDLDQLPTAKACWITFDDGHRSNFELALPRLLKQGLSALFFITADWIGADGFMSADQISQLHREGMLIGTHGCSHRYFADLTEAEVRREMAESKEKLEAILHEKTCALSLPGGRSHPAVPRLAEQLGYRHIFTSRVALAGPDSDPLAWPRIAVTARQHDDFVSELVGGDYRAVRQMARAATFRAAAQRLLGNRLYDRLRGSILGHL